MTPVFERRIDHPGAWRASDFASKDDLAIDLEPRDRRALEEALQRTLERGLGIDELDAVRFPLADIAEDVAAILAEVQRGRGLALLRGFPIEGYSEDEIGLMYFGLGCHFGAAVSQSVMGDRLGRVTDMSWDDPNERAYRNRMALPLHTDINEIIAMLSLRTAKVGGASQYASALAVHNEMLARRRDLLPHLYEGFPYHRRGEEGPGQAPVTPYDVPLFSQRDGFVSCRYIDSYMEAAAKELGVPMPAPLLEAVAYFADTAQRDDFRLDFVIEPGELVMQNNFVVLHGRSAFEDDPAARRVLLRLWLDVTDGRPVVPEVAIYEGDSIARQEGRRPIYAGDAFEDTNFPPAR